MKRFLVPVAAALALGGCQLRPLYAGGSSGTVATTLSSVTVTPIEGQVGWLVYNKLRDRLGAAGTSTVRYRLEVQLDDDIIGLGIRGDRAVTRERRSLRARYQLVDVSNGSVVLDSTAGSDAGIDVVSSEYATVAAEQTAAERLSEAVADQIVTRLGQFAARAPSAQ